MVALPTAPHRPRRATNRRVALGSLTAALAVPPRRAAAAPLSHEAFTNEVARVAASSPPAAPLESVRQLLYDAAWGCVLESGGWVVPSPNYAGYQFCRDSFWVCAGLRHGGLSGIALAKFEADQASHADGHIATALHHDAARPVSRDRDDESTLLYVVHSYVWATLGGSPARASLQRAYEFIRSHVVDGRYITRGETRTGEAFAWEAELGTHHYWADTYRPAGRPEAAPVVLSYNQGLYCVALLCLEALGAADASELRAARRVAESVYATMASEPGGLWLPQRESAPVVDVSALVPEALSLYLFDRPLLTPQRVGATLERLAKAHYPNGAFLGFKVIAGAGGDYRPSAEFIGVGDNTPGNYHNGGSWLLYDGLALYAAARHGVAGAAELFVNRLGSEVSRSWASHEFISTDERTPGASQGWRDGYGWNVFVASLCA